MPPLPMVLDVLSRVVAPTLFASALTFTAFLFAFRNRASDFGAATAFLAGALVGNAMTDPALPWRPERFGWNWLFIAAAFVLSAHATHFMGATMSYEQIGSCSYRVYQTKSGPKEALYVLDDLEELADALGDRN